ncbi:MAG: hypothetical protein K0R54_1811 [Clostridiaceae bacterium]|jgi:hypothetical protein|nr:hypothetical protein [Clostridiaceae bacterium]
MENSIKALIEAFPDSFMNNKGEFIAHKRSNEYLVISDCKTPLDLECKVIEWLSRPAYKSEPFSQKWRNDRLHEFMLNGINNFLNTEFTSKDMELIYTYLGNACNHKLTVEFVTKDYDMTLLEKLRGQK